MIPVTSAAGNVFQGALKTSIQSALVNDLEASNKMLSSGPQARSSPTSLTSPGTTPS